MTGRVGQALVVAVMLGISGGATPAVSDAAPATEPATTPYLPVGPVRLADTREASCGCSRLDGSTLRVDIVGRNGVPDDVVAVAVTVTALPSASPGFVTAYPSGAERPLASTLNTRTDRVTSNSTIVPVGDGGSIELYQLVRADLVVDVTGAFVPSESSRHGRLVSVSTRRLIDTRTPSGAPLAPHGDLTIPLPSGVAADASALVVNVTSVGEPAPGYLSARPAGTA